MAEMTKKVLNKIKAAAFTEFKQGFSEEEFRNLFAGGKNVVTAWRITEGTKSKIVIHSMTRRLTRTLYSRTASQKQQQQKSCSMLTARQRHWNL